MQKIGIDTNVLVDFVLSAMAQQFIYKIFFKPQKLLLVVFALMKQNTFWKVNIKLKTPMKK